jgi:hypothetical protein
MLAGCGESSESKDTAMVQTGEDGVVESGRYTLDADTPAWKLDTKEDTTLTWYVNAEWWNTEWGNDVVTKQIQKDMNVNIDFVVGDDTKLNTFFTFLIFQRWQPFFHFLLSQLHPSHFLRGTVYKILKYCQILHRRLRESFRQV